MEPGQQRNMQARQANPAITRAIYSHVLPGMQDEAAERLAAVLHA